MKQNSEAAIRVKQLSKSYNVYARPVDLLKELITGKPYHTEYEALRDVSFEVNRGEVVSCWAEWCWEKHAIENTSRYARPHSR